ncbi:MAG: 2-oxo acid dehydrogenase subunit E2 [Sedimentisphaerales bacterium]|nr:2-oxo acid dehydrogenase subunit E2 [Sedimentisphaerales bacterium]
MDSPTQTSVPLTRIQKLIGARMASSKRTKPCFYLECKADVTELMGRRHKLSKALGVKITSNAFLIRALALAARQFPLVLGRLDQGSEPPVVKIAGEVNVGIAVNSSQGLVVPVIRQADTKGLAEIALLERLLTQKARSNRLTLEDIEGETIALSNLGAYDIDSFLGIVPPATSAILAVGNVGRSIVPSPGRFDARKTMSVSLAVDHSIVGPEYAATFLTFVAALLGQPERLIQEESQCAVPLKP